MDQLIVCVVAGVAALQLVLLIGCATALLLLYLRFIRRSRTFGMLFHALTTMDEIISNLLEGEPLESGKEEANTAPRPRRGSVPGQPDDPESTRAGRYRGATKPYLGRALTVEQIDAMGDDEIERLHSRYQAQLGASMTKTLGLGLIRFYCTTVSRWLPIDDVDGFESDLRDDPFVEHALGNLCCQLYHRYGAFLAPVTTALTTAKHCVRHSPQPQIPYQQDDVGRGEFAVDDNSADRGVAAGGGDPAEGP